MKSDNKLTIVGIGASAGGLEALEQFFTHIPPGYGACFIVIQHLDPSQQSILPDILQRSTMMAVAEAKEGMEVNAECVYVIPPNKDLAIKQGKLHLSVPIAKRGLRLPIDFFFLALAQEQKAQAVGVILSGMGTDGTLGLIAIKEQGGLVAVQTPDSAKFDAMPQSAINTGLADIVATPEELWQEIAACRQQPSHSGHVKSKPVPEVKSQAALAQIVKLLLKHTGNDFSLYKNNTLYRRIERRMNIHQIDAIAHYVALFAKQ